MFYDPLLVTSFRETTSTKMNSIEKTDDSSRHLCAMSQQHFGALFTMLADMQTYPVRARRFTPRYSLPGPHSKWQIYKHNPSELGAPRPATPYQAPTPSGRYTNITRQSSALPAPLLLTRLPLQVADIQT